MKNLSSFEKSKPGLVRHFHKFGINKIVEFCVVCHVPLRVAYAFLLEDNLIEQEFYNQKIKELDEFEGVREITPKFSKCYNCKFVGGEGASLDYPYPIMYCVKSHWEGGDPFEELKGDDPWKNCKDYKGVESE